MTFRMAVSPGLLSTLIGLLIPVVRTSSTDFDDLSGREGGRERGRDGERERGREGGSEG